MQRRKARFWLVPTALLSLVAVMLVLVSFSTTLYRMFCSATGAAGTTQRASASTGLGARSVTVAFATATAPGLPWRFVPLQREVRIRLGEESLVFFQAENLSDQPIVGHATFNVTPDKIGIYFKKIQCFCFTEERLGPHQKVEMPVTFFVDRAMGSDPSTSEVADITLSYTFFRSARPQGATDLARFATGPADPQAGRVLFAERCAGCHGLDRAIEGPALRAVYGRRAGSVPGYPYTPALAHAGITWTEPALERWLADPRGFIAGTAMPAVTGSTVGRRDIIAYLRGLSAAAHNAPARPGGT